MPARMDGPWERQNVCPLARMGPGDAKIFIFPTQNTHFPLPKRPPMPRRPADRTSAYSQKPDISGLFWALITKKYTFLRGKTPEKKHSFSRGFWGAPDRRGPDPVFGDFAPTAQLTQETLPPPGGAWRRGRGGRAAGRQGGRAAGGRAGLAGPGAGWWLAAGWLGLAAWRLAGGMVAWRHHRG